MIQSIRSRTNYSVRRICSVLGLPRSSYHYASSPTPTQIKDAEIGSHIKQIFETHSSCYGYRRIASELVDRGIYCSHAKVRRLMKRHELKALQPRSFVPRTSDGRADRPSINLIKLQGLPDAPNQAFAGDITHIPTKNGWVYLAVVLDLYTRRIVGWDLSNRMPAELVLRALKQAVGNTPKTVGRIFHSDRGSQYGSKLFRNYLAGSKMLQSMSARANPYDNAWSESVIGTIKRELVRRGSFESIEHARKKLFTYIEGYYNTRRKHSSLDYRTPFQAETQFYINNK